ncbi:MAG: hypothetical protein ABSG01_00985 [Anaerolineales bacterium]|jgi:hypothetical protein
MSRKYKRQAPRQLSTFSVKPVEFNPDYSIIKRELKHIAILAGTFFAFLIVLAIFQNQLIAFFGI